MEQLKFTTRVLGSKAAYRLKQHQVTQTFRSHGSNIVQTIMLGKLKVGDQIQVMLDGQVIGLARFAPLDSIRWIDINTNDAIRGGFDNLDDLEGALQRAGYRFKPINMYRLYRLQFSWQVKEVDHEHTKSH